MTTMDYTKTMQALSWLKVETGSLACLGCGCENNCSIHGCAILRNAREHMEAALANYDHLSALVDQQAADFKLCQKYLADSEAAWSDLARQLAAAQKELAEVKAEQTWISVKYMLPERTMPPHDVLVYHNLNCGMFIDRAWYSHEKNKWRSAVGMNLKVTHWIPLPAPPEKEA